MIRHRCECGCVMERKLTVASESAATTESREQREERWIDWTSRPYQFVPLNLYDEMQKLSEIAVGEMLAEIKRLREALV